MKSVKNSAPCHYCEICRLPNDLLFPLDNPCRFFSLRRAEKERLTLLNRRMGAIKKQRTYSWKEREREARKGGKKLRPETAVGN